MAPNRRKPTRKRALTGPKLARLQRYLAESERQYADLQAIHDQTIRTQQQAELERAGAVQQLERARDAAQDAERRATEAEVARDAAQAAARSATAMRLVEKDNDASARLVRVGDRLAALVEAAERRGSWQHGTGWGGTITGRFDPSDRPGYVYANGQWMPVAAISGKPSYETLERTAAAAREALNTANRRNEELTRGLEMWRRDCGIASAASREWEGKYKAGFKTHQEIEERAGTARGRLLEVTRNVARTLAIICGTDDVRTLVHREGATGVGGIPELRMPAFVADCLKAIEAEARGMAQRLPPAVPPCPSPDCSATVTIKGRQVGATHRAVVGILTDYTDERITLRQAEGLLTGVLAGKAEAPKVEEAIAKLRRLAGDNCPWFDGAGRKALATKLADAVLEALS